MPWAFARGLSSSAWVQYSAYENIPDLSVTFVLDQAGPVSAWLSMTLWASVGGAITSTALRLDTAAEVGIQTWRPGGTVLRAVGCPMFAWPSVAAGTHTINGRWAWGGAAGQNAAGIGTERYLLVQY